MYKKNIIICWVLVLNLFLAASVAAAEECDHRWNETALSETTIISSTDTTHIYTVYVGWVCVDCGEFDWRPSPYVEPVVVPHTMRYIEDKGHGANDQHFYLYECTTCKYRKIVSSECIGPPCPVTPINKVPNQESETL